jgi:hypothetical protein
VCTIKLSTDTMDNDTQVTIVITWVFTWLDHDPAPFDAQVPKATVRYQPLRHYCGNGLPDRSASVVHVVLIWGTNNISAAYRHSNVFTDREICLVLMILNLSKKVI